MLRRLVKESLLFGLLILVGLPVLSQHIQRKGSLGVAFFQSVPDTLAQRLQYKQGAIVQFPLPNTTAAKLGLVTDDIIVKVNETAIKLPNEILPIAKNLRANDKISVEVIRKSKLVKLQGLVVARPLETSTTATLTYGEFAYKKGYVRTIYKTPKDKKPVGTIYFLQGLPCYSMDNFKDQDMTKQALDAMVAQGFAVYRIEKGDMGDNVNTPACETMGFNEELEMYREGYRNLLTLKEVDTSKIFLFGHSMGGVTAPLIAEEFHPKGVAVYGTVFKPWSDYLLNAVLIQSQYHGADLIEVRDLLETIKPYVNDFFYKNVPIEEICKTEEGKLAMKVILDYNPQTKQAASGRDPLCHKELNQHNLARAWANTKGHVLAIYGECDLAAINPDDHKTLIDYVNKVNPGKGTFWLAPGTTHTFEEIGTMEQFMKWQKNPVAYNQYAATRFNPKVFEYTCNWMKSVLN